MFVCTVWDVSVIKKGFNVKMVVGVVMSVYNLGCKRYSRGSISGLWFRLKLGCLCNCNRVLPCLWYCVFYILFPHKTTGIW